MDVYGGPSYDSFAFAETAIDFQNILCGMKGRYAGGRIWHCILCHMNYLEFAIYKNDVQGQGRVFHPDA